MREVDRRTMESGIPGLIRMENAGHRIVEFLAETFAPLAEHHIVVLCGKGNNGGDGFVVARQLYTRMRPRSLDVVLAATPEELRGDAAENFRMLEACGCPVAQAISPEMRGATIVLDALLGTGLKGPATGRMLELIREINGGFPQAKVVAVDIPSGLDSDTGAIQGEAVRADYTVTLTAPKVGQVMPPGCDSVGELRVCPIGSPSELYEKDDSIFLSLVEAAQLRGLFLPRAGGAHKGDFGHILVIGGSRGKTGAAAMAGVAALRSGAGLVTVASAESAIAVIASHAPELMTEPLPETEIGSISKPKSDRSLSARLTTNA
jgi:NAD(P)H-hydrate epimerase